MKAVFLVLTVLLSFSASAGEIFIKEFPDVDLWGGAHISSEFEVNKELGRAWVKVSVSRDGDANEYRVKIPGLTYNSATAAIEYEVDGQLVECAHIKVKGRGIFKNEMMKATERCEFIEKDIKRSYDDGFEIKTRRWTQVFLSVE